MRTPENRKETPHRQRFVTENRQIKRTVLVVAVHRVDVVVAHSRGDGEGRAPLSQLLILQSRLHFVYILLCLDAGQDTPGQHVLAHGVGEVVVFELLRP